MSTTPTEQTSDQREGFWEPADLEGLRERYRTERDRRMRSDGILQFTTTDDGELSSFAADPWSGARPERDPLTDHVDVTVIGSGFGGLVAASYLRKAGLDRIRLTDVAADVGGTWYWNRYPGIACDIESYIYLPLLEEVGEMPSRKYAHGQEIHRHAQAIARRFDLYRDALFQTEVTATAWDDEREVWTVRTDRGDEFTSRYLILSTGPFNRPKLPDVPGIGTFAGHTFHTSRWDYAYTGGDSTGGLDGLADKRVAIVGTGATAIQVVPQLARHAAQLYVVQRTPSTVDTRGDAPTDTDWWSSLPAGWQYERRQNFVSMVHGMGADQDMVDDKWTDSATPRGIARLLRGEGREDPMLAMELADHEKMEEIRARVADVVEDPETAAALQPWYRQMCKRPTFSDLYLQAFNQENVALVDTRGRGIDRITENGFVVDDVEYPVDVIIWATGYEIVGASDPATRAQTDVRGRQGIELREHWAGGARTLHGFTSHGFPNMFILGVSQNTYSVNFTHILEEQGAHVAGLVAEADARGDALVEPSAEAEELWVRTVHDGANPAEFEFSANCTPGYYNGEGQFERRAQFFAGGPLAFQQVLAGWLGNGGVQEVLTPKRGR